MSKKSSAPKKKPAASPNNEFNNTPAVTMLLSKMAHPMNAVIESIRQTILSVDSAISEGVKWNSPSFYCNGWFATISARKPDQLEIVLHHGAKVRPDAILQSSIRDLGKLLKWASPDRAIITIQSATANKTNWAQLHSIIEQWVAYQKQLTPLT